jgi:hypothetical protein
VSENKALAVYLKSLERRPEESPVDTYLPPEIEAMEGTLERAALYLETCESEEEAARIKSECEEVAARIVKMKEETPPISVRFVRLSTVTQREITLASERHYADAMKRIIETDGAAIRATIEEAVANEARIEALGEPEGFEAALKERLVTEVLRQEGMSEESAREVADTHPEMRITERDERELRVPTHLVGVDALEAEQKNLEAREALLASKRQAIIGRALRDLEERREELSRLTTSALISKIVFIDIASRARMETANFTADMTLYHTACDPDAPRTHEGKIVGYEPLFPSVAAVAALRESESLLYQFLIMRQDAHDATPFSMERIREISDFDPFRSLMETLPD